MFAIDKHHVLRHAYSFSDRWCGELIVDLGFFVTLVHQIVQFPSLGELADRRTCCLADTEERVGCVVRFSWKELFV